MYIKSIKVSPKKLMVTAAVLAAAIAGFIFFRALGGRGEASVSTAGAAPVATKGETAEQRTEFLKSFGWEVKPDPTEITEVLVPTEFNKTYEKYNIMQKKQGFDLSRYKGRRVKMWSYEVTNYPGNPTGVHAVLLICDGEIIGGDISSDEQNKFTHGFSLDDK